MQNFLMFIETHWMLSAIFAVCLLLLMIVEFIRMQRGARKMSPQAAVELINRQNAIVIDIRTKEAFRKGHLINAISLPFDEIPQKINKINQKPNQPILIVCAAGLESPRAIPLLKRPNAFILAGGIRSWQEADLPLIKEK